MCWRTPRRERLPNARDRESGKNWSSLVMPRLIASGLFLPTAMTFGPDGALYVSNVGFGPPPNGLGQVLRITIP